MHIGSGDIVAAARRMENVVFDIGQVLLHLDYRPLMSLLRSRGFDPAGLDDVISRIGLLEHESGRLDGAGLLDNLAALAPQPVSRDEARDAWLDMFDPQPRMFGLAERLAQRHRVFLLSNVGDLHWAHIHARFGIGAVGHDRIGSFEVGVMKPDPGIYALAEQRFGLDPAATVFIDDRHENILAARTRGWHGIVHGGYASTAAQLQALGILTE